MAELDGGLRMLGAVALLAAEDVEATATYYRDKFGFEITSISQGRWARLNRGPVELHIEHSDTIRRLGYCEKGGLAIRVNDVDAWSRELQQRGAKFDQGPMNQEYGWRDFSIIDPNGYQLCFWQPLDETGIV